MSSDFWRPTMGRLSILALVGALVGTSVAAMGQEGARGRTEAAAPTGGADGDTDVNAEGEEVEETGGSKVKVYQFGGLDISGRLKSPQLLYFLNRLRAEFDRPRLPHRSFMPELVRSSKTKTF
jgi:hypothetical protein